MTDLLRRAFLSRLSPVTAESTAESEAPVQPVIDKDKCIAWQRTICYTCKDRCLEKAILSRTGCDPVIEHEKCTSCGECVTACFATAISMVRVETIDTELSP